MIIQKSEEILKQEKELEEKRLRSIFEEKEKQRKFELDKARIETSVPQRWKALSSIFVYLFNIPIYVVLIVCCTFLMMFNRKIPDIFDKIIK